MEEAEILRLGRKSESDVTERRRHERERSRLRHLNAILKQQSPFLPPAATPPLLITGRRACRPAAFIASGATSLAIFGLGGRAIGSGACSAVASKSE